MEALIVVDVQNDFCPTGAPGVPAGRIRAEELQVAGVEVVD